MDGVKQWAMGVALCAVIGAVIYILLPKGSTQRLARTAVSLFLLVSLLSPFLSGIELDDMLGDIRPAGEPETQKIKGAVSESVKEAVREKIEEILVSRGINDSRINIDITIDGENQMEIESIKITAPAEFESRFEEARKQIYSQLGANVEFEVEK